MNPRNGVLNNKHGVTYIAQFNCLQWIHILKRKWKQLLVFLQICKGRKSGDEKRLIFSQWNKWVDFLPKSGRKENWKMEKNGWFLPIYLEGRKRELKDGEKRKIFCQCKRKGFCLLQFERKGAMNLVQDLSPDNLLSIRQLRIKMRKVKRKRQVEKR